MSKRDAIMGRFLVHRDMLTDPHGVDWVKHTQYESRLNDAYLESDAAFSSPDEAHDLYAKCYCAALDAVSKQQKLLWSPEYCDAFEAALLAET